MMRDDHGCSADRFLGKDEGKRSATPLWLRWAKAASYPKRRRRFALPAHSIGCNAYSISSCLAGSLGTRKSGMFRGEEFASIEREEIKKAVKQRSVRLVVATDAACEGLNLQTLGTLINVDLPWNPSRLEQRLGRIKRIGQARRSVDMLNLVYHHTRDEDVYRALSRRMKDKFDIFGGLPDTIEDDWIETVERMPKLD